MKETTLNKIVKIFKDNFDIYVFEKNDSWYISDGTVMIKTTSNETKYILEKMKHFPCGAGRYYFGNKKKSIRDDWCVNVDKFFNKYLS